MARAGRTRRIVLLLASLIVVPALRAQQVRGRLTSEPSREPVQGAIVVLLDAAGRSLAGVLTDGDGRFAIGAPAAGTYSLRIDLVGFQSTVVASFALASGDTLERSPQLALLRTRLPTMTVIAGARCGAPGPSNRVAAALWTEARKTLDATRLAQAEERLTVSRRRYDRDLVGRDSLVRNERATRETAVTSRPYASLAPDSLARVGYRIVMRDSVLFIAPDADVLLSDIFVASHCFQAVRGSGARRSHMGLAFRPERRSRRVDIEGTLWLDSAGAELRALEFRYASEPTSLDRRGGGLVEFARAPGGLWIVKRWSLSLPLLGTQRRSLGLGLVAIDTLSLGVHETGGEVLSAVTRGARPVGAARVARLRGVVIDSTTGAPLAHALIRLEGTGWRTRADTAGRFAFDSLYGEGRYVVSAAHPRADSLGASIPSRTVIASRGSESFVELALPRTIFVAACPEIAASHTLLTGTVRDAAGALPLTGIAVSVIWSETAAEAVRMRGLTAITDAAGRYAMCEAPLASRATIVLHREGRVAHVSPLDGSEPRGGPEWSALVRDFSLARDVSGEIVDARARSDSRLVLLERDSVSGRPSRLPGAAALEGVIMDPAGEIVRTARVELVVREGRARMDSTGIFAFEGTLAGPRELRIRASGYAPVTERLTLRAGERRRVLILLVRDATPPEAELARLDRM